MTMSIVVVLTAEASGSVVAGSSITRNGVPINFRSTF